MIRFATERVQVAGREDRRLLDMRQPLSRFGGAIDPPIVAPQWSVRWLANNTVTLAQGDILLGSQTWIAWASITSATASPAITSTNVAAWIEVDLSAVTAVMVVGTAGDFAAPFDAAEAEYKFLAPLVKTTWTGSSITGVEAYQCGIIRIARAA